MTKIVVKKSPVMFTIGHSTHTLDAFISLLKAHAVTKVADIRTVPRSRHNPEFNYETLPDKLGDAGIGYIHVPGLGGLRRPAKNSINMGWRNLSFRGFADYMQTQEFEKTLQELIHLARSGQIVLMCAEAVPWRCHRSLIADALQVRSIRVEHILGLNRRSPHSLTPFARVNCTQITYPK